MNDQANDREATNPAVDRLIQSPHQKKVLDERYQDGHGWVFGLPVKKGLDGAIPIELLKRDVDLQRSEVIGILDQGHLGLAYNLDFVTKGYPGLLKVLP